MVEELRERLHIDLFRWARSVHLQIEAASPPNLPFIQWCIAFTKRAMYDTIDVVVLKSPLHVSASSSPSGLLSNTPARTPKWLRLLREGYFITSPRKETRSPPDAQDTLYFLLERKNTFNVFLYNLIDARVRSR
jgi:hypothetical protein